MMDKVEVRVPRLAPFTRRFAELYREIASKDAQPTTEKRTKHFHSSQYYQSILDLREFEYSAILFSFARLSKTGDHKIEFIETGRMGYSHTVFTKRTLSADAEPAERALKGGKLARKKHFQHGSIFKISDAKGSASGLSPFCEDRFQVAIGRSFSEGQAK